MAAERGQGPTEANVEGLRPKIRHIVVILLLYAGSTLILALVLSYLYIQPDSSPAAPETTSASPETTSVSGSPAGSASTVKKDLVQAAAILAAGGAALAGVYITWMTLRSTQRSTQDTLQITEEGQVTERFSRAIDHLAKTNELGTQQWPEARLGGIYALERIAKDSEKDYWTIMEIIAAYIRQNARLSPDDVAAWEAPISGPEDIPEPDFPSLDIQAALGVLRRRTHPDLEKEEDKIDLRDTNLPRVNLEHSHLERALFLRANLVRANFVGAHLEGANFFNANLRAVLLRDAKLQGASFQDAYLEEAAFTEAILDKTNFQGTRLLGADLRGTDLREAENLTQEQINEADGDVNTKLPEGLDPPDNWSNNSGGG